MNCSMQTRATMLNECIHIIELDGYVHFVANSALPVLQTCTNSAFYSWGLAQTGLDSAGTGRLGWSGSK